MHSRLYSGNNVRQLRADAAPHCPSQARRGLMQDPRRAKCEEACRDELLYFYCWHGRFGSEKWASPSLEGPYSLGRGDRI